MRHQRMPMSLKSAWRAILLVLVLTPWTTASLAETNDGNRRDKAEPSAPQGGEQGPVFITHAGEGSGTLNGVPFGVDKPVRFTFDSVSDISDRRFTVSGWKIEHSASFVTLEGIGTFEFLVGTSSSVSNVIGSVGFGRTDDVGLFSGPANPAFDDWALTTSIGPFEGNDGIVFQWHLVDMLTDGGLLFFNPQSPGPASFEATIFMFSDGFETGDLSAWSLIVP